MTEYATQQERKSAGEGKSDKILQRRMKEHRREAREIAMQATDKERQRELKNWMTQKYWRKIKQQENDKKNEGKWYIEAEKKTAREYGC